MEKSLNALNMRKDNYKFLDTGTGLSNCSRQTKEIYAKHQNTTELNLRYLAFPESL
jgi:hypothetical protein